MKSGRVLSEFRDSLSTLWDTLSEFWDRRVLGRVNYQHFGTVYQNLGTVYQHYGTDCLFFCNTHLFQVFLSFNIILFSRETIKNWTFYIVNCKLASKKCGGNKRAVTNYFIGCPQSHFFVFLSIQPHPLTFHISHSFTQSNPVTLFMSKTLIAVCGVSCIQTFLSLSVILTTKTLHFSFETFLTVWKQSWSEPSKRH